MKIRTRNLDNNGASGVLSEHVINGEKGRNWAERDGVDLEEREETAQCNSISRRDEEGEKQAQACKDTCLETSMTRGQALELPSLSL